MNLDYPQTVLKLKSIGQTHLLKFWNELNPAQKHCLLKQIASLNIDIFHLQRSLLSTPPAINTKTYEPYQDFALSGNTDNKRIGMDILAKGQAGCLLIAGGQGTRLRFNGPKGLFPVSVVKHKTLFQLFAEKTAAASKQSGTRLPLAIMTSPQNHAAVLKYFKENAFFGLNPTRVSFFCQGSLPLLDEKGDLFLDEVDLLAEGPDGNGGSLQEFARSGIARKWQEEGIKYVNYVLVDNALADPFDAELLGFHVHGHNDVTVKGTMRLNPSEKVGLIIKEKNGLHVVEYTELPESERVAVLQDGSLKHKCANLSLFCFALEFILDAKMPMPLHLAHKAVPFMGEHGRRHLPDKPNAWKFEKFIFDVLPQASRVNVLLYPRDQCFAPLKNASGTDSPETVRAALQNQDRGIIRDLTGSPAPEHPFELSQEFHYPTQDLLQKWNQRDIPPDPYIEF